jgi:predicted ATP-dependent serine protease
MLLTRHLHEDNAEQFRPGVEQGDKAINLDDEFERQFFGDLMLFSVTRLTGEGSSGQAFILERVSKAIDETEDELLVLYEEKHRDVQHRIARL